MVRGRGMIGTIARAAAVAALIAGPPLAFAPSPAAAQSLRVLSGGEARTLDVPLNRAIVVESDTPFAELSIANPAIADISTLSDRTVYVLGKAPGATTLTLLSADGGLISNVTVRVEPDLGEFKQRLGQILPGEPIEVRSANDGIVLSGTVSSIARLDRALDLAERYAPGRVSNLLAVGGTQQVTLKVRFAEMSRSVSKGLNGGLTANGRDVALGGGQGGIEGFGGAPDSAIGTISAILGLGAEAVGGAVIGFDIGSAQFDLLLQALEERGLVRTLAEPNLTALSGQQASFLAGGEYPVPIAEEDDRITVDYKPFGIELDFVPRVIDGDVINLELKAATSAIDPSNGFSAGGFTVDAFTRRETSTTVELRDGESFAIAGLLSDDFQDANRQVPFLGDIPVIGALFRSASYQRQQTELVILVTAHLVTPARGPAYALPTDNVVAPSERDLFLYGRTEGAVLSGGAAEVARQDFSGSYGYVLD